MESELFYRELRERGLTISDLTEWEWDWIEGLLDGYVQRMREQYPDHAPMMLLAERLWELRNKVRGRGEGAVHTLRGYPLPTPEEVRALMDKGLMQTDGTVYEISHADLTEMGRRLTRRLRTKPGTDPVPGDERG